MQVGKFKRAFGAKKILYAIVFLALFSLIIAPLISVFKEAVVIDGRLDFNYAIETIFSPGNSKTITNSLLLGVLVVICSTLIAMPLAFILVKTKFAKSGWLDVVLMIPFMTPPYIASMGWILFMQKRGLFQQIFPGTGSLSEAFFSLGGLTLTMSFHLFPFMTTILKNALLNIGDAAEESAAVSGGTFFYRLRKITLPLLTGNYAIAALLVFVKTLSEYGTPATLGKRIGFLVFTTDIHRYATTAPVNFAKASSLSAVLIVICLLLWSAQSRITSRRSYSLAGGKRKIVSDKTSVNLLSFIYITAVIFLSIGIPYFSVVVSSFIKLRGFGMKSGNYTFANYAALLSAGSNGLKAIGTSLKLAFYSATISSCIGTFVVRIIRKQKIWKKLIEGEALLPSMIPNIVLVIGMMIFWNKIYRYIPLYNTFPFMVLVYVVMFLPFSVQYITSSVIQTGDDFEAAGAVCGGSRMYVFRRITLPLIAKGIISGWMMIFIISYRELVAASLVSPPNTLTVSNFIVREFEQGTVPVGMAMAVICMFTVTVTLIFLNRFTNRMKIGGIKR